jgi:ADP-ribose pyrophosphatase YjhB (NUDIX family)
LNTKMIRPSLSRTFVSDRAKLRDNWIPEQLWLQVKRHIPIPCVDVILENSQAQILLGWRLIPPYREVWALPGGRIYKGENLEAATKRILAQYDVTFSDLFLVGVFPIRLVSRSDFTVCVAGEYLSGVARPDGKEFSSFRWTKRFPKMGANYRRMISMWLRMKRKRQVLQFNKLN